MITLNNYLHLYLTTSHLNTFLLLINIIFFYSSCQRIVILFFFFLQCGTYIPQSMVFGLQNSLSIIHPLIMLLLYSILLKMFFFQKILVTYNLLYKYIIGGFVTLGLGGWWAFQEFNWGGWWNWDSIETPVFLVFMWMLLICFHVTTSKFSTIISKLLDIKIFLLSVLLILYLPRFGLTNSVHAFISTNLTYTYYCSLHLCSLGWVNILCVALRFFALWTFFFIKIILVWGLMYIFMIQIFKSRSNNYTISHKLIYLLIIQVSLVNYKHITLHYYFGPTINEICLTNLEIFYCYCAERNEFFFWLKPTTFLLVDVFGSLKSFLN